MAVYAPKQDYTYIKSQNPYADIQLYNPGTKLTAKDIGLGGINAEGGISDEYLGGAQRYYGNDKAGTANEYYKYLSSQKPQTQLTTQATRTTPKVKINSKDPMASIIGNDPEAAAYYKQAQQAAKLGSRNAMETLNTRGILNSSITGDTVTGLEQQAMTNVLPQLYAFQEQKKQQAKQDAFTRMNTLGYADNEVSKVLGIPVGTPSASYSMQEAGLTGQYKGQQTLAAQQFDYQKQQDQWAQEYQQKGFDADTSYKLAQLDLQKQQLTQSQAQFDKNYSLQQQELSSNNAYRNASLAKQETKPPTVAELNYQQQGLIGQVTSAIYDKIYTQNNSSVSALSVLTSNKGAILSDLTSVGMSAKDALEFYQSMYDDLSDN